MFLAILTLISGLGISAVAAYYSIIGLSTLFSGAVTAIIIMGIALEVGKLVTASWLYRNWKICNFFLRYYLLFAVMVLVFVTSIGIFGFLSKAHLDQVRPTSRNTEKIAVIEEKIIQYNVRIDREQGKIDRAENDLRQLDKAIDVYQGKNRISKSLRVRNKQKNENLPEKPPEEWCKFSEEIKKSSSKLASIVRNAVPQSLDGPDLKLVFKSGNYATMLTQESKKLLENIASEFSGHSVKLICEDSNVSTSQKTIAEYDQLLIEQEKELKRKKAKEFPLVKDILSVFKNSKITSIELSDA